MQTTTFETLTIPRRDLAQGAVSQYRVYKDAENFVLVEGHNALEALKNSGISPVRKIERNSLGSNKVLGANAWAQNPPAVVPAEETPPAAEAAAADAPKN